ncbi:MAG: hypothetical protein KGI54_08815 [Pseudomonadota bacterium]|nr:hypothetical protein [Pseudomonadota bacterium]
MIEEEADKDFEALMSPHLTIEARSLMDDDNYTKCPRCWHYHTIKINYDGLCDACCKNILEGWPNHESAPFIMANLDNQRKLFTR